MQIILHTEASMGWGGQEIRVVRESLGMKARGYRLTIAAPSGSTIFRKAKEAGIEVVAAEFNKRNPLTILHFIKIIDKLRPDIINTHSSSDSWVAAVAAMLAKCRPRVIRTRHLSTPISRTLMSRIIYDILPDAVMTTGEEIRRRMAEVNGFRPDKIFSVPTGIDLSNFDPLTITPAFRGSSFNVGMVGVLRSWKGHRYFIEAIPEILTKIPEAHFYITGDGPQKDNIKKMISDMKLATCVSLLGHRDDIPEVLASLSVVVHPSYGHEGVPQTVLQAFAMKRPVIATNVGAIPEIVIDNQTGLLIEARDPHAIAENVIALYEQPEKAGSLALEGRRLVEAGYSLDSMLNKIEGIYNMVLHSGKV